MSTRERAYIKCKGDEKGTEKRKGMNRKKWYNTAITTFYDIDLTPDGAN